MSDEAERVLTETKFWLLVLGSLKRTIICSPENESRIKSWLDARQLRGVYGVDVSRFCPDTTIYLLDEDIAGAIRPLLAPVAGQGKAEPK